MPIISIERSKDRHDSILSAASAIFSRKGYEAASIAEIAQAAGVSDGLVYKYFASKRDLLVAALTVFYERVISDLDRQMGTGTTFRDRLRNLIRAHLGVFANDPGLCRLFISEVRVASDYSGSSIQQLNKRYTAVLVRIVREGIVAKEVREDTDPTVVRDLLFGAIEHMAWRHIVGRRTLDCDRLADQVTAIIVGGIAEPIVPPRRRGEA